MDAVYRVTRSLIAHLILGGVLAVTPPAAQISTSSYRIPIGDVIPAVADLLGEDDSRSATGRPWRIDLETFAEHPRVLHYLEQFRGPAREDMVRSLQRGAPYVGMIQERLRASNLPAELTNLALIESGFSNTAVSRAGATGMWQLMPSTAREYGLRVDESVDERRDPFRATEAAILHLRDLMERFQSPYLAAAAYNAGSKRIDRGLERLRSSDSGAFHGVEPLAAPLDLAAGHAPRDACKDAVYPGDADFFRLSDASLLVSETSDYVPKLIAASIMVDDPDGHDLTLPPITPLALDSLVVTEATLLDEVARNAGLPVQSLRQLNPQYIRGITPKQTRSVILLPGKAQRGLALKPAAPPAGTGARMTAASPTSPGLDSAKERAEAGWKRPGGKSPGVRHAPVRRGDTVESIAERYGVSEAALRRINVLPYWYELRPGQILQLPESAPPKPSG